MRTKDDRVEGVGYDRVVLGLLYGRERVDVGVFDEGADGGLELVGLAAEVVDVALHGGDGLHCLCCCSKVKFSRQKGLVRRILEGWVGKP